MLTVEEIKVKVEPIAKKYNIPRVYLFGSFARKEAKETNDIDLAIETEDSSVEALTDLSRVKEELEKNLEIPVDVAELKLMENPVYPYSIFKKNFYEERLLLYEEKPEYRNWIK